MKTREELQIEVEALKAEAEMWMGAEVSARKEMCDLYAKFHEGDHIKIASTQTTVFGIVEKVRFQPTWIGNIDGFIYTVRRTKANGNPTARGQEVHLWENVVIEKVNHAEK